MWALYFIANCVLIVIIIFPHVYVRFNYYTVLVFQQDCNTIVAHVYNSLYLLYGLIYKRVLIFCCQFIITYLTFCLHSWTG